MQEFKDEIIPPCEHSPTPWKAVRAEDTFSYTFLIQQDTSGRGPYICTSIAERRPLSHYGSDPDTERASLALCKANAEFIVRACNAHDELVAAVRAVAIDYAGETPAGNDPRSTAVRLVRAALERAKP